MGTCCITVVQHNLPYPLNLQSYGNNLSPLGLFSEEINSGAYSKEPGYKIFTFTCNALCSALPCVYYTSCIIKGSGPDLEVRMWLFLGFAVIFQASFQWEKTNWTTVDPTLCLPNKKPWVLYECMTVYVDSI